MKPSIVLVSLSAICDDPRVRRQGDLLQAHGFRVCAAGLAGGRSAPPEWPVFEPPGLASQGGADPTVDGGAGKGGALRGWLRAWRRALRSAGVPVPSLGQILRVALLPVRLAEPQVATFLPELALRRYWERPQIRALYAAVQRAPGRHVLANDWTALPIAARIAAERGGRFGYDTHEFAVEEYGDRLSWRLLQRPFVRAIERRFIRQAVFVSAVSEGIARGLRDGYRLPAMPYVIRNLPRFQASPFRAPGETLEVLYHGILARNRGLEATLESVPTWRDEFRLTIRGPGQPEFVERLRRRIASLRLEGRVRIDPPVPMTDLIRRAQESDVGLFALPSSSAQNVYALPNKIFEYVMAGLALCVTDLPEMASVVQGYGLGHLMASAEPGVIAAAVNAFTRESIVRFKRRALEAAQVLNWEAEGKLLLAACEALPADAGEQDG